MTQEEKISYIKALAGEEVEDNLCIAFLKKAESAIRNRMYPFRLPPDMVFVVPEQYESLQCELALRYIDKMGAEGETIHIENGIDRHYDSTSEEDLLREVMQVVV